jgi:hypothetical protein
LIKRLASFDFAAFFEQAFLDDARDLRTNFRNHEGGRAPGKIANVAHGTRGEGDDADLGRAGRWSSLFFGARGQKQAACNGK